MILPLIAKGTHIHACTPSNNIAASPLSNERRNCAPLSALDTSAIRRGRCSLNSRARISGPSKWMRKGAAPSGCWTPRSAVVTRVESSKTKSAAWLYSTMTCNWSRIKSGLSSSVEAKVWEISNKVDCSRWRTSACWRRSCSAWTRSLTSRTTLNRHGRPL